MPVKQTKPKHPVQIVKNRSRNKYDKSNQFNQGHGIMSWHHDDHEKSHPLWSKQSLTSEADHALTMLVNGSLIFAFISAIPSHRYCCAHRHISERHGWVDTKLKRTLCWNPADHNQSWNLHPYGWLRVKSYSCIYGLHAHDINITWWSHF